jgi:hypothetical protein
MGIARYAWGKSMEATMAFEPTEADQDALGDFWGGKARAAAPTKKKRSEIAKAAAKKR